MDALTQDILSTISTEVELSRQLINTLEDQKKALEQQDITMFENSTANQEPLIIHIQKLHEARANALSKLGFEASPQGLNRCLSALPSEQKTQLDKQWGQLRELHNQLQRQLYFNKHIVDAGLTQVSQILDTLYDQDNFTYGPNAVTKKGAASRPLSQI